MSWFTAANLVVTLTTSCSQADSDTQNHGTDRGTNTRGRCWNTATSTPNLACTRCSNLKSKSRSHNRRTVDRRRNDGCGRGASRTTTPRRPRRFSRPRTCSPARPILFFPTMVTECNPKLLFANLPGGQLPFDPPHHAVQGPLRQSDRVAHSE
jgi:hypothetical protein